MIKVEIVTNQVEGIVLKTTDYQEKSKICQVFTKEHGLISIIMKGANNYKQSAYQLAQPLTHASFAIFYREEGLSNCFKGEVLSPFQSLKTDFTKNVYVYHLFEILLKSVEKHQAIPYLYELLLKVIEAIDEIEEGNTIELYTLVFEIKCLYFLGVTPQIDACVECGSDQGIVNFDVYKGGLVCRMHQTESYPYQIGTLKTLIELFYVNVNEINLLLIPDQKVINELRHLVDAYYDHFLGLKTNSRKYFTNR
jgi:DNA repair protein RecO (recombination protein O)